MYIGILNGISSKRPSDAPFSAPALGERKHTRLVKNMSKPPAFKKNRINRKRSKAKIRSKKRDPLSVNGERPRPMFVDYKDVELLKKLTSRQGKIISRRKTGCSAVSQHAVAAAVKRARFMALMPYVGD